MIFACPCENLSKSDFEKCQILKNEEMFHEHFLGWIVKLHFANMDFKESNWSS